MKKSMNRYATSARAISILGIVIAVIGLLFIFDSDPVAQGAGGTMVTGGINMWVLASILYIVAVKVGDDYPNPTGEAGR